MSQQDRRYVGIEQVDLAALDLRTFLDGRNPYGEHDSSLDNAFTLGKATMQEIVAERSGMVGGRVLDLLSGFGRWIPFLASVNTQVVALERLEDGTTLARNLCTHLGIDNAHFMTGDISRIEELETASFDYVWMWSGLQYVDRAYALTQIRRVLRPGGRVFVGAYNATGLMIEHVHKGAEHGTVFEGASQWALPALARGPQADGNPSFIDPEGCAELCARFGLRLIAVAPQYHLDLRRPDGRSPDWETAAKVGAYFRTVEFVAERSSGDAGASTSTAQRGRLRRALGRFLGR